MRRSTTTSPLSSYIIGLEDKTYLAVIYGGELGKARVSAYCIKFSSLRHINVKILEAAIRDGIEQTST